MSNSAVLSFDTSGAALSQVVCPCPYALSTILYIYKGTHTHMHKLTCEYKYKSICPYTYVCTYVYVCMRTQSRSLSDL